VAAWAARPVSHLQHDVGAQASERDSSAIDLTAMTELDDQDAKSLIFDAGDDPDIA